jgi:hypothetical protein
MIEELIKDCTNNQLSTRPYFNYKVLFTHSLSNIIIITRLYIDYSVNY